MTRTRIAEGVYRDKYGYEVRWRDRGRPKSKRFPLDAPLDHLKIWRANKQRASTGKAQKAGSFVRDAARWLSSRKHLTSFKSDRAHLRPWIHAFQRCSRFGISRAQIGLELAKWRVSGYSPRELRHRLRILSQFFAALDPDEPNPCVGVKLPAIPKARPRSVPDTLVREVALNLRKSEIARTLRDAKTRARYLVLATTGQRPAQLRRATQEAVDLERRVWFVEPAKGDNGAIVYLNDDMLAAWTLFAQAKAWGDYDGRSFVKTLRRNGWPKGIRPYNLRHTVGLGLSELGVDLGDIQAHMGHTSPATTRIYVPGVLQRLREASEKLDGRLDQRHALPPPTTTAATERKAKTVRNTPHSSDDVTGWNGEFREPKSRK